MILDKRRYKKLNNITNEELTYIFRNSFLSMKIFLKSYNFDKVLIVIQRNDLFFYSID